MGSQPLNKGYLVSSLEGHSETGPRFKPALPNKSRIKQDVPWGSAGGTLFVSPPCTLAQTLSCVLPVCGTPCSLASMLFSQWTPPTHSTWEGYRRMRSTYLHPSSPSEGHHRPQQPSIQHRSCQAALAHSHPSLPMFQERLPPLVLS